MSPSLADESRNREVAKLGVTFVLVPNGGTTRQLFESGLQAWRKSWSDRRRIDSRERPRRHASEVDRPERA